MTVESVVLMWCCTLAGFHLHGSSFSICDRDSSAIVVASLVFASLMTEEVVLGIAFSCAYVSQIMIFGYFPQ
jgi:hypothetical protein